MAKKWSEMVVKCPNTKVVSFFNEQTFCVRTLSTISCPFVCPYTIYSHNYGRISTLKVPMDFLGPGGGYKTICRVIVPEMKKNLYYVCSYTMCVRAVGTNISKFL